MTSVYSETFVLPLPDRHRFRWRRTGGCARGWSTTRLCPSADDPQVPDPIAWDDLRLVHGAVDVDAVANGTLPAAAQRRIGFSWWPMVQRSRRSVVFDACRDRDLPLVVAMSGGYGSDVEATSRFTQTRYRRRSHICRSEPPRLASRAASSHP